MPSEITPRGDTGIPGEWKKDDPEVGNIVSEKTLNLLHQSIDEGIANKNKIKKLEEDIDTLKKQKLDPLKKEIDNSKTKVIETLGIFIALFTFISVTLQIFSKIPDLFSAIFILLILLFSIGFFVCLIDYVLFPEKREKTVILMPICLIALLIIFGISFRLNKKINPIQGSIEFQDQFEEWTDEKLKEKREDLQENFYSKEDMGNFIENNENNKEILDCLKNKGYFSNKCFE